MLRIMYFDADRQAAVTWAELLPLQHRVDTVKLLVDAFLIGIDGTGDLHEAHAQLFKAVHVFLVRGLPRAEHVEAFQLLDIEPVFLHACSDHIVVESVGAQIIRHTGLDVGTHHTGLIVQRRDALADLIGHVMQDTVGEYAAAADHIRGDDLRTVHVGGNAIGRLVYVGELVGQYARQPRIVELGLAVGVKPILLGLHNMRGAVHVDLRLRLGHIGLIDLSEQTVAPRR